MSPRPFLSALQQLGQLTQYGAKYHSSLSNGKGAFKIRLDCGTNVAVTENIRKSARPALDFSGIERLALRYVERYATSRARLASYLQRKIRERGWGEETPPPIDALVDRMAELGYVDDRAFAEMKAGSLTRRGYGARRIDDALRLAGIDDADAAPARANAAEAAWDSALRFAMRKKIGPFAAAVADEKVRRRHFSAMLRAGHPFEFAKRIVQSSPGEDVERP